MGEIMYIRILKKIETLFDGSIKYYDSPIHGIDHLRQVSVLAGVIALHCGADVETAMIAGFLHDIGRTNDLGGNQHALDSAVIARPLLLNLCPHIAVDRVCDAIARHADGLITDDPLAAALWDADRLALRRLGRVVREDLLSTEIAKAMRLHAFAD
jgi:putative nucleotidyltransferase with HDIG domain